MANTTTVNDFSISQAFIYLVRWFSPERAIGFCLIFTAGIIAFEPLRDGSLVDAFSHATGLDVFVLSFWYTLGGLYLLYKGQKSGFGETVLCIMPMVLVTMAGIYVAFWSADPTVQVNSTDISREVFINVLIWQRLLNKLTVELLERFGLVNTNSVN